MAQLGDALRKQIVRVKLDGALSPKQLGLLAGTIAKTRHATLVADGKLPEANIRFVDGAQGAPETTVKIAAGKPGIILYKGSSLAQAAAYALEAARQASQRISKSGTYAASWRIFVNGQEADEAHVPPNAQEAIVVNITPYARRLEQGTGRGVGRAPYLITEIVARATKARFSGLVVLRKFVSLSGASSNRFPVPYHLKRPPGGEMLYPSVVISLRAS